MVNASIATVSATLGVGSALGLPLVARVVEAFDWHALIWLSAVLAAGLVSVLVGVTKGNDWGWASPLTVTTIL